MELGTLIIIAIVIYAYWGSKSKRRRALHQLKNSIDAAYANTSLEAQKEYLDEQSRKMQQHRDEEEMKKEEFEEIVRNVEAKRNSEEESAPPF